MANIIPSGKAGFMTLMSITRIPIENPYTHLPILVLAADTGSVAINTNPKAKLPIDFQSVWLCASSWRPHKRLKDNIKYFLEFAPDNAVLAIAGKNAIIDDLSVRKNKRIFFLGEIDYLSLLSLYKASSTFIHLAYLDHCPNVVVDAQASGCHVVCSSAGGTKEVVYNGTVISEDQWDFKPIPLYKPPKIDFTKFSRIENSNVENSMVECSKKYYEIMQGII